MNSIRLYKGAMLRNIGNVVCFIIVLMTSHHVTGQAYDVTQLNRMLTILKNSVYHDIVDIRLEIMDLKMTVEQIGVGQRNASDESIIGQGMTDINPREISDLKNKLSAHESRLNKLFSTVNQIQMENSVLKSKVNQVVVEKENKANAEILRLNAGIETKFDDKFNALQKKFEETTAVIMKSYKDLKRQMLDQTNTFSQSVISEQNKLSTKIDKADAKIVRLDGEVNKLEVNALVEKRERNELIKNLKAELLQLNAGVETKCDDRVITLQKRFEETTAVNMVGYKDLETHISDQMNNFSQSLLSEQNKLSTKIDKADAKIVRLDGEVNKLEVNSLVEKKERNELIKNLKDELLQLNAGVETKCDDRVVTLQKRFEETTAVNMAGYKDLETHLKTTIDCGDPIPDHGTVNTTVTKYGTVVKISCNHGYVLSGENIIKCNADSVWSKSATCNPYDCGDPTPDHGTVNTTVTTYGTVVKISCNNGYVLSGENIIKCNADSGWSASATCNLYDSAGRQFIFGIPETAFNSPDYIKLYIASKHVSKVYITAPGIGFNQTITTLANTSTAVVLPNSLETTTGLSNKAVYVEADQTISIYVMVRDFSSSDGFLLLPISADAREFVVASYEPYRDAYPSEFLIIALEDSTLIDIQLRTSAGPVIIGGKSYSSGQNVSLKISRMQTYLVQHEHDLTGTHITSSKPVSVVSGTRCAFVPHDASGCDFLVEQMLPVSFWQREYVCAKLKSRGTNRLRILSSVDGTSVNIGANHIKLNKGEFYEYVNSNDVATPIESNFPVLVLQYAEGGGHDSKLGDPSMITIPSLNGQGAEYFYETATTLAYHYVSITIRTDQANGLNIDGSTVSRSDELKTTINTTEISVIRLSVTVGKHHIYHVDTYVRFGVIVYGFDYGESYGFPLGLP
ncbi:uncharacterized protein LOC127854864 isoform X8 [Dreissena polymorpha]|uniref:uncharacterized protein LOC127854864 isoform X7 n=1 Tax=Dreissena polymorpha TaxID=45954 RepID=UPI002264962F|nr:uncharacterized protein LOC127854864 isoform X7 [Dreissena polymorpha]XP_052245903.1 uncharacterized protein LOC127854864 isoform X8 [Dreissena polymorpha]